MDATDTQGAVLNTPEIRHPRGSRKTNRVAFYWNPTRRRGLYVHDLDTRTTRQLTAGGLRTRAFPEDFLWGHDGQQLFYIQPQGQGDFDGPFDLQQQTIDPNADATTIFTDDTFFVLEDMHPERSELLLSYRRGRSQLYRLTLASGALEQVSDHRLIRGARYSPDGHWIALNTAYTEDASTEHLHGAIVTDAGESHIDPLASDPVECLRWHPSTNQLLVTAADDRNRFGIYDVRNDQLRWIQTDVPQCHPVDFLPSGEGILTLCEGMPRTYPIAEDAAASSLPGVSTSVAAATVTAQSLVFQQHDDHENAILSQYTTDTDEETPVLTSESGPGATYRPLITDVAKQLARTPRLNDDDRMTVGTVHPAEREVLAPLLTEGFEIIGTGLGRLVLRFPQSSPVSDYVLKLARFGTTPLYSGAIQNQWEATVWNGLAAQTTAPLLPIVNYQDLHYRWLVMPYGEPITDQPLARQLDLVAQLQTALDDITDLNTFDIHRNNIVRYQDAHYLADYGRPLMD